MDKDIIYLDAFIKTIKNYNDNPSEEDKNMYLKRAAYYGVKFINTKEKPTNPTIEKTKDDFQFSSVVKSLLGLLTPKELINIFPVDKVYDGHKWQSKDYFYTMDYINDNLKLDDPIGEDNILKLLWEYTNTDLMVFNVKIMGYMSDLRQLDGYPSISEEWADKEGIAPSPSIHRNDKDERFIIRSGKIEMLDNPKQSHLRLVK